MKAMTKARPGSHERTTEITAANYFAGWMTIPMPDCIKALSAAESTNNNHKKSQTGLNLSKKINKQT